MSFMARLLGPVIFLAAGTTLTALVPLLRDRPWYARLAYSYLFGMASICGVLYVSSHFFGFPLSRAVVLGATVPLAVVGGMLGIWRMLSRGGTSTQAQLSKSEVFLVGAAATLATLVSVAVIAKSATEPVVDWDGRMTWVARGHYIRDAESVDADVLRDPRWLVPHPDYPLLMPLAQTVIFQIVNGDDDRLIKPVYAFFFPVFLCLVFDSASAIAGRFQAAITLMIAASLPFPSFNTHGGAAGCYSDLPLACFAGAGLLLIIHSSVSTGGKGLSAAGLASGLLLAAAVLTKSEGLILALGYLLVGSAYAFSLHKVRRRPLRWRPAAYALPPILVSLALLASWSAGIPDRLDEAYWEHIAPGVLLSGFVERGVVILAAILKETLIGGSWVAFWPLLALLVIAGGRRLWRLEALALLLASLLPLFIGFVAYLVTDWPVEELIAVTWHRFLLHALLPSSLLLSVALERCSFLPPVRSGSTGGPAPPIHG